MQQDGARDFDVDAFLDGLKIGRHHILVIGLLILTMLIDGYDLFVVGLILPAISRDWGIAPAAFTGVFVAQQFGILLGVVFFGPFADRYGRRTTLLICLLCFAVCTYFITWTTTPAQITAVRFVSAIFFSGVIPNCVALASEIAPKRLRATMISIVFCGYTGGSFIGASALAFIVEPYGWESAFYLGTILPLAMIPILFFFLPESIRFRATRNPNDPRIGRALQGLDPSLRLTGQERFLVEEPKRQKGKRGPIGALFQGGLLPLTLMVWLAYFMAFLVNQMLNNWGTTILNHVAGIPMTHVALLISVRTFTGIIGTATVGFIMDRVGAGRALPIFYMASAILTGTLAFIDLGSTTALVVFGLLGYATNSGLAGLNAQAAITYPPRMRVTGIAWGSGVGRIGGMLGPIVGGALIAGAPDATIIYLCATAPELFAGAALYMLGWYGARRRNDPGDPPEPAVVLDGAMVSPAR
ncbi:MAG: transporter [Sphingomonas bacterium]|nr:MFS transporter [Sphingomonas bacterium]MDB5690683.1 transporter [Sphingomonas bacterium]